MATNRLFTGSTKDILDLRKTVENQAIQLQAHQEEIKKLKDIIQSQQEKYLYLLDSNSQLWTYVQKLGKQIPATTEYDPVMDKENIVHSNAKTNSTEKKKYKEKEAKEKRQALKKINEEELQDALDIERTPETLSEVQRILNIHPSYAKEIGKVAKNHQKKNKHSSELEEKSEFESDNRRKKEHRNHHHKNHDIVEKITLERKVYKKKNIHDYLSSTIDDTLQKFDISPLDDHDRNYYHHRHNHRQHLPSTPTIKEVTSSSSASDDDDYVEEPRVAYHRRRDNHDSAIEATTMPDKFDDDDMSSDTEPSPPRNVNPPRQRVGDRLRDRRH